LQMPLKAIFYRTVASVDYSTCVKCGICARACPTKAVNWAPRSYPTINLKLCTGCSICANSCPKGSIRMVRKYSVLPVVVALSLLLVFAVIVYAVNMATQPPVAVEGVGGTVAPVESWYEKYKGSIWEGKSGEARAGDPLSAPSGG
jgi:Pyruvate/2-oxoacid:ferredoxin oxidoreductase delta subunit/ABC-type cobalt transport system substrate-binding protein